MRKYLPHIIIALIILTGVVGFSTHVANAGNALVSGAANVATEYLFGFKTIWDFLGYILSYVVWFALLIASWFLIITGMLLDVSITITLHIKDFVNSTPVIYDIWRTIRDISGLFIIFALLYAAIQLIIGPAIGSSPSFGKLIKNIVIAGILINFSFFMTSVLIDASNVVSLAIYNAMVPEVQGQYANQNLTGENIIKQSTFGSAQGISNVFMNALKIQKNFDQKYFKDLPNGNNSVQQMSPIKVILTGITGVIIMFTVGMSFIFASLAFIIRLVILIGLLIFSPIWFAASVVPMIGDYATKWWSTLKNQLIFMPVYLLLMYVAISILNKTTVFNYSSSGDLWQGASTAAVPTEYITFAINAAFIIIMLNLPLLAALKVRAGNELLDKFGKSIGATNIWSKFGGVIGVNTMGRAAVNIDKKLSNNRLGNLAPMRDLRANTIGVVAGSKYGGDQNWEAKAKEQKEISKKDKEIVRRNKFESALRSTTPPPAGTNPIRESLNALSKTEKLALGTDNLKKMDVVKHLKSDDFEAIKKSDDISDEDKSDIFKARKAALEDAVDKNQSDIVKHMVDNMDGKDLMKIDPNKLKNPLIVANLKASHLKTMEDEGLDGAIKQNIGNQINNLGAANHKAYGFVKRNSAAWT